MNANTIQLRRTSASHLVHQWTSMNQITQIKQINDIALLNKTSQSYETSLAIWDHTVLPATQHD